MALRQGPPNHRLNFSGRRRDLL